MKNTKTSSPALSVERSEAERSEDERSAAAGDQGIADRPNPEVVASAKRRSFTAGYKQRILAEADKAKEESGGIGALLRRPRCVRPRSARPHCALPTGPERMSSYSSC